jgi:hypothetical protein
MLPCDIVTLMAVCEHVHQDIALETLVIMIRDPTAVQEFVRLAVELPSGYTAHMLMETCHRLLKFMDQRISKAEDENLTRQGSGGLASAMTACQLLQAAGRHARPSGVTTVRLGSGLAVYKLHRKNNCLNQLLNVCRNTTLPAVTAQDQVKAHMDAYAAMLAQFPPTLQGFQSELRWKHLLCKLALLKCTYNIDVKWTDEGLSHLRDWGVDCSNYFGQRASDNWTLADLEDQLPGPAHCIPMWACLFTKVANMDREFIKFSETNLQSLRNTLAAYKKEHAGVAPCPHILLSLAVSTTLAEHQ